jgi:tape measure domain-containing protein
MAQLKIDLIVDNKGSIQIQKFGLDAEKAFSRSTGSANTLRSSIDKTSSSLSSFGAAATSALAIFSTYEIFQFIKSIGETVVKLDSMERAFVAISGSQQGAAQEMQFLRETSDRTGQDFYKLAQSYQQLTASTKDSASEGKKTRDVFEALAETAAVLGLSQERVDLSVRALGQMASKGTVQMEELKNQLGDHIPGAVQIVARALGLTTKELYDLSAAGDLLTSDMFPALAEELRRMYRAAAQTAALQSGQSAVNKLSEAWTEFKANIFDSQMVIDTIWGITHALRGLSKFAKADGGIGVGIPFNGGFYSLELDALDEKELRLRRVASLQRNIADYEQRIALISSNSSMLPGVKEGALKELTSSLQVAKTELTKLNKVVNNESPYVTGEAAGKLDVVAQAYGHIGFQMQGVRAETEKERKASAEANKETLKYIETSEQRLIKARDAAMAGARSDEERSAVSKKYAEELAKLQERGARGGGAVSKQAAREAEQLQREYQAIIDRLLPLETAQREYTEGLAAMENMDPSKSTERYQTALANLNKELQRVQDSESGLAEARAAAESAISAQQIRIAAKVAQGQLTETGALPFEIDLLRQRLQLQQDHLATLQKTTPQEISAYNSQVEAIERVNLELIEKERLLRLRDGWEGAKQALVDYADMAGNMGESVGNAVTNTFRSMEDAMVDFVANGKADFTSLVDSIVADLARIAIQRSITGPLASGLGGMLGGVFGGGGGSTVSSNFSLDAIFNAKGNVFSSSGLSAYSGSVVSSPTIFPFASGVGLMGEAGPEAILPLKRLGSGKLGVESAGSGANVVVNVIESPGKGGQQQQRKVNGVNVIDVFVESIKASIASDISVGGGSVPAAMSSAFGLNRVTR